MVECDGCSCTFHLGFTLSVWGSLKHLKITVTGHSPLKSGKVLPETLLLNCLIVNSLLGLKRVKKIPCRDIEPHIDDSVQGNDNCLFRAFSKEVTGTESNHQAVRQTILNFMTHKDNAHSFCKDCFASDSLAACLYEPIESMTDYIKENRLDECGWGTDCEIRAFATLCQIDVCTYSEYVISLNHLHIVNVLGTVNIELMYMCRW